MWNARLMDKVDNEWIHLRGTVTNCAGDAFEVRRLREEEGRILMSLREIGQKISRTIENI